MTVILKTTHNTTAGFFSNCSMRLDQIKKFFKEKNELPQAIDSSAQFRNYKENIDDLDEDLAKYFFEEKLVDENTGNAASSSSHQLKYKDVNFKGVSSFSPNYQLKYKDINFRGDSRFTPNYQYLKYKDIGFRGISPFVKLYFSPSLRIINTIETLENKYSIDYDNTCSVYYRGNDKDSETGLAEYEEFFNKATEVLQQHPNIKFLIQTDELEFAEAFEQRFSNSFWFDELSMINHDPNSSVHHSLPRNERKEHASWFLAAIIVMSKTKHLITYSGNCGLWAVLYRGNSENVYQYLKIKSFKTKKIIANFGWT